VVKRHTAKIAHGVPPTVEQQWHDQDFMGRKKRQPGVEVGQEALRTALKGLVREPPAGYVPSWEVALATSYLNRHRAMSVVLPQV
jgi:hypothetical protein